MTNGPHTEYALSETFSVTIPASGEGWIRNVGPRQYGEEWIIESTQTIVENSVAQARLRVFRNGTTQQVEGTYSANLDTSDTNIKLRSGEFLSFKYEGADSGSIGRITLSGTRRVAGRRGY